MQFLSSDAVLPQGTLQLANTEDVLAVADSVAAHPALALHFPKWTDGRAYSQAVLLRARVRFVGQLIATGDVLADMLPLLRRCGFDTVQLRADQRRETAERALGFYGAEVRPYQATAAERAMATDTVASSAATDHAA